MSIYFFIQLPREISLAPDSSIPWLRWDNKKATILERGVTNQSLLAGLASQATDNINVLIVPGEDIRALRVTLPNKSKAAFKTIPYQLEENLSSKIEDLHIISGKIENNPPTYTATNSVISFVTEHSLMQRWQQFIEESQIKFHWLVADFTLLPMQDNLGSAWSDGSRFLIRSKEFQGALSALTFNRCKKDYWHNFSEQLNFYSATDFIDEFPKTSTSTNKDLLAVLAENFAEQQPDNYINLLQGRYRQNSQSSKKLKQFIAPASVALCVVLSFLAHAITTNVQLKQQDQHLKQQMTSVYKSLFPKDRRITNPYAQMRGKLKQGQSAEQHQFLKWVSLISPILRQQNIVLITLKYDKSPLVLRLQVEAADYNTLENVALTVNQLPQGDILANLGTLQKSSLNNSVTSILTLRGK